MSLVIPARAIEAVAQAEDAKKAIQEQVGDLSDVEVFGDMVLVGVYIRPEKTAGGIIRPQTNVQEDLWQGKAALVLKHGPDAFRDPDTGRLYPQFAAVGDWCICKVGDGWGLNINGYPCKLVRDVSIRLKVKDPNVVF